MRYCFENLIVLFVNMQDILENGNIISPSLTGSDINCRDTIYSGFTDSGTGITNDKAGPETVKFV